MSLDITILPFPAKNSWILFIISKSFICKVILYLTFTYQPVLVVLLLSTLTTNDPSASVNPVINQGSIVENLQVLVKVENCLLFLICLERILAYIDVFQHSIRIHLK